MIPREDTLARFPLFAGLPARELTLLREQLSSRQIALGEYLFREGDPPGSCFLVLAGGIEVTLKTAGGRVERLATLGPGALVGHMALINSRPRSASCRARAVSLLAELTPMDFDRLFNANSPFAFRILDKITLDLVGRLRAANTRLAQAHQEQNQRRRQRQVKEASALLSGAGHLAIEFDEDIDLDSITYEKSDLSRRMNARR